MQARVRSHLESSTSLLRPFRGQDLREAWTLEGIVDRLKHRSLTEMGSVVSRISLDFAQKIVAELLWTAGQRGLGSVLPYRASPIKGSSGIRGQPAGRSRQADNRGEHDSPRTASGHRLTPSARGERSLTVAGG
ncbi:MAG: hypothetical protein ACJ77Q_08220, partial [Gemmatimonadaceae bacterium]